MPVNWGLAQPQSDPLDALRYFGQAQMDQLQRQQIGDAQQQRRQQMQVREQQMAARPRIAEQVRAGDFQGARTAAVAVGDTDYATAIGGLSDAHRKQLADETELLGRTAFSLKQVPLEQRAAAFQRLAPQLKAAGFADHELAAAAADLSDGVLDGYIGTATTLKDQLEAYNAANKPMVVSDGSEVFQNGRIVARNPKDADYIFDPESGDWLLKPGTGGGAVTAPGAPMAPGPAALASGQPQQEVAAVLQQAGIPAPVIAGFMGNFHAEGGYDGSLGDGGTAAGIAQWRGPRQDMFRTVIGKDVSRATPAEQAQFVAWELQNPTKAGMTVAQRDAILAARTPGEAASLIDQFYERSSGKHRDRRVAAANSFGGQPAPQQFGGTTARIPSGRGPKQEKPPSGYAANGDGTFRDIRQPSPADMRKEESNLRQEFNALPEVKDFKDVRAAYQQVKSLATRKNPSAADDISLIFSYMKLNDPSSTVREGEFATAQNAAGVPDRLKNAYNAAIRGNRLNGNQRQEFLDAAGSVYLARRDTYNSVADRYRSMAKDYGYNEGRVAPLYLNQEELQRRRGGGDAGKDALRKKYGLK